MQASEQYLWNYKQVRKLLRRCVEEDERLSSLSFQQERRIIQVLGLHRMDQNQLDFLEESLEENPQLCRHLIMSGLAQLS